MQAVKLDKRSLATHLGGRRLRDAASIEANEMGAVSNAHRLAAYKLRRLLVLAGSARRFPLAIY